MPSIVIAGFVKRGQIVPMIWEHYQQEKKASADQAAEIAEWEAEKYSSSTDGVQVSVNPFVAGVSGDVGAFARKFRSD